MSTLWKLDPSQTNKLKLLRETIGLHTCDRRSSKTWIHENYPTYLFEHV